MAPDSAPPPLPLQNYQKGVIKPAPGTCDPQHLDHIVLIVGFGKTKSVERRQTEAVSSRSKPRPRHSTPYWILKNSWGAHWGEEVSAVYGEGKDRTGLSPPSGPDVIQLPRAISGCTEGATPAASPSTR